ncbi:MAG: hypothetical protein QNJ98_02400 [Planctomycetota bacterium]|nr:hypothetical protein [Planctomycetota bacterium]
MLRPATTSAIALTLAFVLTLGLAAPAHAAPKVPNTPVLAKLKWPDVGAVMPKVGFKAKAKIKKTTVKLSLVATIKVAGKTFSVPVFDMGLKKSKKSIKVKRKVGKLSVSLKVSWKGEREITIKGTAKYMKFKVPVPPIKVRF